MNTPVTYKKFAKDYILNSIRRVLVNEIPTWTFDNVQFKDFNSSIYNMEYIIQRLRLIPLIQDLIVESADRLSAKCNVINNTPNWRKVTPKDIIVTGMSINDIIDKDILNNLPIVYLPPNESLQFTMSFARSSNNGYNKYCHAWYDDKAFYVESIGKCSDTTEAIRRAINYLVKECTNIKGIAIKESELASKSTKVEITFSLTEQYGESVSRSALNIIVKKLRDELTRAIAYVKWFREHKSYDGFPSKYASLVQPDDFIVSVVQPHMSEHNYKVFIDLKEKYLETINVSGESEEEKYDVYVPAMFEYTMQENYKIKPSEASHPCYRMFCQCVDLAINELNQLQIA